MTLHTQARNRVIRTAEGKFYTSTYKDPKQELEEEKVKALISLFYAYKPPEPLSGPLMLGIRAYLPIAESRCKGRKGLAFLQGVALGTERPTGKPDLDNLVKNIKDIFKGVFWKDDSQVVGYMEPFGKFWVNPARWEILILTLDEYLALKGAPEATQACAPPPQPIEGKEAHDNQAGPPLCVPPASLHAAASGNPHGYWGKMMPEKPLLPNALEIQGEIEGCRADVDASQRPGRDVNSHYEDALPYLSAGLYPPGGIRFMKVPELPSYLTEALDRDRQAMLHAAGIRKAQMGRPRQAGKSAAMDAMARELLKNNPGAKLAKVSIVDGQEQVHTTEAGGELQLDADGVYRPKGESAR